ncbi:phosphoenolpyruvate--protein phosphotransferase PtsP [Salinivibrio sp. AR647]|uniref:phosphoenolpyruvate--protein phosphotransferase n=1 Tax=Salinivibrio sp. AR647 TaxID=1909438 RepID=UPI000987695D|nr:phosphoenolpyruvate--protein phosphotransferase [Salinivibrio sp. AR647]OOE90075.1 phosphoenolpyruvate--protein phosphotransferase PtsP [Salinivibrio sp. AR647]
MLTQLRNIVQSVAVSADLDQALHTLVQQTCLAMRTECCSVYLANLEQQSFDLMATQGLDPSAQVSMSFGDGLVGVVGQRAEPLNLAYARRHPAFKPFPATGEDAFQSFLGTPIIYRKKVLGVLVVQQHQPRQFDESEESFLVTLAAQLAVVFAHADAQGGWQGTRSPILLEGMPASPGIGIAQAWCDESQPRLEDVAPASSLDVSRELDRLDAAIDEASTEFRRLRKRFDKELQKDALAIFDLFVHLLNDPMLREDITVRIQQGDEATWAVRQTVEAFSARFSLMDDPYLKARADDVKELGQRLLYFLMAPAGSAPAISSPVVLLAHELTAGMLASIPRTLLAGVVAEQGAANSHAAILARALGIPAIMGVSFSPSRLHHKTVILDGHKGVLMIEPAEALINEYLQLVQEEASLQSTFETALASPGQTQDGTRVEVHLNAGLSADSQIAINQGVDGVGLFRTEVPFLMLRRFPSEDEQVKQYRAILASYPDKPVVMRTLDIGGDKPLPYLSVEEDNPFLGWRGIRFSLDHPDIFLIQVRAMLRASIGLNNLKLLLPMISGRNELLEAKTLVSRAYQEVSQEAERTGESVNIPMLGIMVEVPSILYQLDNIARDIDFLSVGTNDLTQYLLAVDRNNARVADIFDALHPSVLHALSSIATMGARHQLPVSVCGELAGDPVGAALLVGLGYQQLSMNTRNVAKIKYLLSRLPHEALVVQANTMLTLDDPDAIRASTEAFLAEHGLDALVKIGQMR